MIDPPFATAFAAHQLSEESWREKTQEEHTMSTLSALAFVAIAMMAAQDTSLADTPRFLPADVPVLAPAETDATCGGLDVFQGATCLTAPADQTQAVIQAYVDQLYVLSWLDVAGTDRRRAFVRRRVGGGCDGLQMLAVDRAELTLFVFAAMPGDACAADGPILQEAS